jgi:hypothetical protein
MALQVGAADDDILGDGYEYLMRQQDGAHGASEATPP